MPYLGIFKVELEKKYTFDTTNLQIFNIQSFLKKTEKLPIWDKKCINWIFLGMDLKTIAIFEISTLAFCQNTNFRAK